MGTERHYTAGVNRADGFSRKHYGCGGYCVSGPGVGCGYHSWAGYPTRQLERLEQAEIVAKMLDEAFKAGVRHNQREVQKVIGL